MKEIFQSAEVLIESLPYIKAFSSKTFVIKYGGSAMANEALKKTIIQDIILLKYIGIDPVIVHGGGSEISKYIEKFGEKSSFVNGLRITNENTIDIVQMVLIGKINQEITSAINKFGGKGVGLNGKDANMIVARKHMPEITYDNEGNNAKSVDLGFVGQIEKIDPSLVIKLCKEGYIPVISPIGVGFDGESYNINADSVAGQLAQSLNAEKLIMLTDIDGIYENPNNPSTKIMSLTKDRALRMIENNQIVGGMIPKVNACIEAVENGVNRTHIIDGKQKHSILIETFTDDGLGTMVIDN